MAPHRWLYFTALIFLVSFQLPVNNASTGEDVYDPCSVSNEVFSHGEKIVYKIYYNWNFVWIAAGEVVFEVKDKGNQYHISAVGRTLRSYDWIFKVRDYYDSFIEKETMRPKRTIRKVLEGKYTLYDDVKYRHETSVAISKKGKTVQTVEEAEVPIVDCTHDILSSFYAMRNIDFAAGPVDTEVPMNIYLDRKIYSLNIVYKGIHEDKRIRGLGHANTMLFEPELVVGNVFKENEGMRIWVSNDQNRIPLMVESPISVGSVKAVLKRHSGLRHPSELKGR